MAEVTLDELEAVKKEIADVKQEIEEVKARVKLLENNPKRNEEQKEELKWKLSISDKLLAVLSELRKEKNLLQQQQLQSREAPGMRFFFSFFFFPLFIFFFPSFRLSFLCLQMQLWRR